MVGGWAMYHIQSIAEWVAGAAKMIASFLAILTALAFAVPWVEVQLQIVTAERFGASGYVYYEANAAGEPTKDGNLYLIKAGAAQFDDVNVGDKLQVMTSKYFRDEPTKKGRSRFHLQRGDCMIVVERVKAVPVIHASSGGWLRVATAACGLFR